MADYVRAGVPSTSIVGREAELAELHAFLDDPAATAVLLTGGPGIGKSTLWEAGVALAGERGLRVLLARPSGAEAQLAFGVLIDLFDGIDLAGLPGLAPPQRRALEVALLRVDPAPAPPESRAIAVGLLNALRALRASGPLLIAIDDVPLLDAPSADALAYAARRLEGGAFRFLLARRPGRASTLESALEPARLRRLDVGPLSLGATRQLLAERLELSLPRSLLRRLFEASLGNPLFALELGRTLRERGEPQPGEELPVPERVEDLLGTRVAELPASDRRLLLAVALSAEPRSSELERLVGGEAVDEAIRAGLLVLDGDRVRPSHPLLAAAARRSSRAAERRELHRELARVVADQELRALHLALATEHPDAELAGAVAEAAAGASARGGRQEAAGLAGHALRLTPAEAPERTDRLLSLAEYLDMAGDVQRVVDLLVPELESLPRGSTRVQAYLLLNRLVANVDQAQRYIDEALAESDGDPGLRALVLAEMSGVATSVRVDRIREAEAWAAEALAAGDLAADVERTALEALGWARALRGLPIDDVCERWSAVSDSAVYVAASPERVAGQRLVWRGEIDRARALHTRLQALAEDRGESLSYSLQALHLCELELRAGAWEAAARLLDDVAELDEIVTSSTGGQGLTFPIYERCRALLAAGRGLAAEAEQLVPGALARADASGGRWDWLEAQRARGQAALLAHEPHVAIESTRQVWEHTRREGVEEPGAFPVACELVEALVEVGELEESHAVTERLSELSEQQTHPWGLVTSRRCRAVIRLAGSSYDEAAAAELADAAEGFAELGLHFDQARVLLSLGRAQRRHRKWAAARGALEQAAAAFDALGSPGWAEEARSQLSRVGARPPRAAGELTPAERRVAELAAEGLANKEIARALVVSVKTVETHLSHVYEKLGVRSRTQLARRL